jgi:predicted Abi (CAAX) family protease
MYIFIYILHTILVCNIIPLKGTNMDVWLVRVLLSTTSNTSKAIENEHWLMRLHIGLIYFHFEHQQNNSTFYHQNFNIFFRIFFKYWWVYQLENKRGSLARVLILHIN